MSKVKISAVNFYSKDARIKTAISLLACLSYNNIKSLLNNSYEFQAVLLAKISEINSEIFQLTDVLLEAMNDNYIYSLVEEVNKNNRFTLSPEKIKNIQLIMDNVNTAAEQYMKELELKYDLKEGELTLRETQTILENELAQSENFSKEIFNFIQSKNLLNSILVTLKYDTEEVQKLIQMEESTFISFILKARDITHKYEDILNSIMATLNQIEHITDACLISIYIWNNVCNASRDKLVKFLDRKYSEIRTEILQLIE